MSEKKPREKILPQLTSGPILSDPAKGAQHLLGSECKDCDKRVFPPVGVCPDCLSENMREIALSTRGTLYSYSVLHVAARGWDAPYILAYIDLPEGVRVFAHLTDCTAKDLSMDMPVELRITTPVINFAGREVVAFKFTPLKNQTGKGAT